MVELSQELGGQGGGPLGRGPSHCGLSSPPGSEVWGRRPAESPRLLTVTLEGPPGSTPWAGQQCCSHK